MPHRVAVREETCFPAGRIEIWEKDEEIEEERMVQQPVCAEMLASVKQHTAVRSRGKQGTKPDFV